MGPGGQRSSELLIGCLKVRFLPGSPFLRAILRWVESMNTDRLPGAGFERISLQQPSGRLLPRRVVSARGPKPTPQSVTDQSRFLHHVRPQRHGDTPLRFGLS